MMYSFYLPSSIASDEELSGNAKLLFGRILVLSRNSSQVIYPNALINKELGLKKNQITYAIKQLMNRNLVTVSKVGLCRVFNLAEKADIYAEKTDQLRDISKVMAEKADVLADNSDVLAEKTDIEDPIYINNINNINNNKYINKDIINTNSVSRLKKQPYKSENSSHTADNSDKKDFIPPKDVQECITLFTQYIRKKQKDGYYMYVTDEEIDLISEKFFNYYSESHWMYKAHGKFQPIKQIGSVIAGWCLKQFASGKKPTRTIESTASRVKRLTEEMNTDFLLEGGHD